MPRKHDDASTDTPASDNERVHICRTGDPSQSDELLQRVRDLREDVQRAYERQSGSQS